MFVEIRKEFAERIRQTRIEALNLAIPIVEKEGSAEAKFLLPILRELTIGTVDVVDIRRKK